MIGLNWIIIKSKDRGTDYGVGTFINQLSSNLSKRTGIEVFVIEIGIDTSIEFNIEKISGITYFKVPQSIHLKSLDTISNHSRFARNIVRIVLPFLPRDVKCIVHLNYVFQYFIGEEFKKILDCILIFTQHLCIQQSVGIKNLLDVENLTFLNVDRIIAVTKHGKEHIVNKLGDESKIITIYNGIDPDIFIKKGKGHNIRQKYGIDHDDKIILFCGRIDQIKGLKYLSKAFTLLLEKLPTCRLVIAGDGDYNEFIQNSRAFSSNINYLGFIPFDDLIELYQEASIGVIPSLQEQCSYVALEMLHSGLPVVASGLGGLKEIFIHNKNALLVDMETNPKNSYGISPRIDQFTANMYSLITNDQMRERFSQDAVIRAKEEFSIFMMVNSYINSISNIK